MKVKNIVCCAFVFVSLALLAGCGEKTPDGFPKLMKATVKVTYDDGKPVGDALVQFAPAEDFKAFSYAARTTTDGTGPVTAMGGKYKGIGAGKYKVLVEKRIFEGEPEPPEPTDDASKAKFDAWLKSSNKEKAYSVIGKDYTTATKTPLTFTVDSSTTVIELKVGKEVKDYLPEYSAAAKR